MAHKDTTFLKRQGAHFLSLINDLKRNRQAAADDLDVSVNEIEKIIAGEKEMEQALLDRAVEVWPLNRRDFMIVEDDASQGVLIMRKKRSEASTPPPSPLTDHTLIVLYFSQCSQHPITFPTYTT